MHFFFDCAVSTVIVISKNPCLTPSSNSRTMCSQADFSSPLADSLASNSILFKSRIVQQSLHIFDYCGECEWPDAASFAIERNHIFTPRRAILEHEHFPAAFGSEIEQLISHTP
jgi:hypothetical protein